jgi:hypothetical protein
MTSDEVLLLVEPEGPVLSTIQDAIELIGLASSQGASVIVVPKTRLDPEFFDLKTRIAGEFLQKMLIYGWKFAVIGDFRAEMERSSAFRDFLTECDRGRDFFFVADRETLLARLSA